MKLAAGGSKYPQKEYLAQAIVVAWYLDPAERESGPLLPLHKESHLPWSGPGFLAV